MSHPISLAALARPTALALMAAALLGARLTAFAQQPVSSAFTYQGELANAGTPATGTYDIRFRLYDAAGGGNQIGSTLCSDDLTVTSGRFAASLDFSAAAFAGQQRFLEIEVREDSGLNCSDTTGYTVLSPRQELTASPNATFAQTAATANTATTATNATSLNGQPASFFSNAANLTGTLADARLSGNIARLDGNQTFTGLLNFTNAGNTFAGNGAGLTNLNGGSINAGTLARSSLSADVQSGVGTVGPDLSLSGSVTTGSQPVSVSVSGSFAYVVNYTANTLQVFNISNPGAPTLAGSIATGSQPNSVAVSSSFACVVNESSNTLQVFNIGNPAVPMLAGSVATGSLPASVAVSGSFAYVASYNSNTLQVFDISNPAAPTLAGNIATGSRPASVAVSGSLAYVANYGSNTLQVFDISNPAAPTLAGSVATGSQPICVSVSGSLAYVANYGSNTLQVFDISNPAAPTLAGSIATGSRPRGVAVSGSFAYVVNYTSSTLQVYNISNPTAPVLARSIATGSNPDSIALSGSLVYVVNYGSNALQVFNAATGVAFGTPLAASSLAGVNGSGLTGVNAASLNGQAASFYTNASNITSGTLANAQTTGTNLNTPSTLVLRDASGNFSAGAITAALNGNAATATVAATATNATQLNGQAASFYTNASNLIAGTVADGLLSSNIPRLDVSNNFTGGVQTFDGRIRVSSGIITDGWNGGFNTADLGLYSQKIGFFMRFVTSGGGFVWYTDGATSSGGVAPRMQLTSGGNLSVVGSLSKGGGSFKIDHPLDPENKYLYHSFVESPDMMNVYNGNVTTDADGYATITLPDYFEALNRDFRYQLTVIDENNDMDVFLWAKIVKKVSSNQFTIRSSRGHLEVSWQITGIRHDAWAEKNRIPNSVDKSGAEKGKYLHPEAFGKPASQSIQFSTTPVLQPASK